MDRKVPYILTEAFLLMPDSFEISISLVSVNAVPNGLIRASFRQGGISGIEVFDSHLEAPAAGAASRAPTPAVLDSVIASSSAFPMWLPKRLPRPKGRLYT